MIKLVLLLVVAFGLLLLVQSMVEAERLTPAPYRSALVTTETEQGQLVRALEAGANEYVMKPFTRDILVAKLSLLDLITG